MWRVGFVITLLAANLLAADAPRETINFNADWRFSKEDHSGGKDPKFDDLRWRWWLSAHLQRCRHVRRFFPLRTSRRANQFGGRTWYRKTFTVPDAWQREENLHRV